MKNLEEILEIDKIKEQILKFNINELSKKRILNLYKIKIIRFTNEEIRKHFIEVCEYIENILTNTENKKQI